MCRRHRRQSRYMIAEWYRMDAMQGGEFIEALSGDRENKEEQKARGLHHKERSCDVKGSAM